MTNTLSIERTIEFHRRGHGGRKTVREAADHEPTVLGRVPRVARLLALAIHFEGLVRSGAIANYAELARLGQVTEARISQIMELQLLAPDIQEAILFLPRIEHGRDVIILRNLLPIAAARDWAKQRRMWADLAARVDNRPAK